MSVGDPMETIASVKVDSNTTSVNFTGLTNPIEGKYYQSYMLFCRHISSSSSEAKIHINSTSNTQTHSNILEGPRKNTRNT